MPLSVALLLLGLLVSGCSDEPAHGREGTPVVEGAKIGDIPRDTLALPNEDRSIQFVIIGDSGRGSVEQHEVAAQEDYRLKFAEP